MSNTDMISITGGIILLVSGLTAVIIALFRIRLKEFTLLNSGLFFTLYGLRWLLEVQATGSIFNDMPYLHSLLTYIIPVPFAAFLLNVLGRGLFSSIYWFLVSAIVYAAFGIIYDLISTTGPLNPSINIVVLAVWLLIVSINVVLIREEGNTVLKVLKTTLYFFLFCIAYDNLVVLNVLPWQFRLEHIDVMVLFAGMLYIAILRYRRSEIAAG